MSIEVKNIHKEFGEFKALDNVSLTFPSGELVALLGPSGCGKTTLLRIIAGLETADKGTVILDGEDASCTHVRERQVGFVFQHYALFKHMTVFDNVAFGLRVKPKNERLSEEEIAKKVHELLNLVQLDWLHDRFPSQLSGGQRQRIALARALAVEPRVLLLDEPFGALDAKVRLELRQWLRRLHDQIHLTSIFVTHDQEDAFAVADKVVVMRQGKIEQVGPPVEVFEHPANAFVMDFLGHVNVFKGHLREGRTVLTGYMPQSVPNQFNAPGIVFVRPHELDVRIGEPETGGLPGIVDHMHPSGASIRIFLRSPCGEASCCVELSVDRFQHNPINVGAHVWISPKKGRVFEPEYSI